MKKLFQILTLLIAATLTLTSCHKEEITIIDPVFSPYSYVTGTYAPYDPFIDWNMQQSSLVVKMMNAPGWEQRYDLKEKDNEEYFRNIRTNTLERYVFEKGKLSEVFVMYYNCYSSFDQMMKDYARNYSLEWEKNEKESDSTDLIYDALCPALNAWFYAIRHDDGSRRYIAIGIFRPRPEGE